MEAQATTSKEKTNLADKAEIDSIMFDTKCSMLYFESLKVRDIIVGRIALLILLSVSTLTIAAPEWTNYETARIIIAFLTLFATVALYWVGKNGYFLSVSGLFHIILHKDLTYLKMRHGITKGKAECIGEQIALLESYVADCPNLALLIVFYCNCVEKTINYDYRRLADSPRFRKQLEINFWTFILAHFFTCQRISDEKIRIRCVIYDEIAKKKKSKANSQEQMV